MRYPQAFLRCLTAIALIGCPAFGQTSRITARQVIERIQAHVGVPWQSQTVDTFKDGDPETPITGIATTMMATMEVLQKAAAAGTNLIITHEPVFYSHLDSTSNLEGQKDTMLAAKRAYIREHHLVIWRFHDHWHMRRPDGIETGMIRALGWEKFKNPSNDFLFTIPETTLESFAAGVQKRLGIRTLRVVGNPSMRFTKVGMSPGAPGFMNHRRMLQRDDVEVLVMGEAPEWETIAYGTDSSLAFPRKALVVLGHVPSEQAGMEDCAPWLRGFVPEVPVRYIPASEPFWTPK